MLSPRALSTFRFDLVELRAEPLVDVVRTEPALPAIDQVALFQMSHGTPALENCILGASPASRRYGAISKASTQIHDPLELELRVPVTSIFSV